VVGSPRVRNDERVLVRLATVADAGALRAIYRPYVEQTAISFEDEVPNTAEMAKRVARTLPLHPWLVAEEEGTVVGYAYAHPFAERAAYRWSIETSAYVATEFRGRRVGPMMYSSLLALAAYQGYREAFAGIALPNPASVSFHEKMGFRPVGVYRRVGWKLGSSHDVGWWQRPLGDPHQEAHEEAHEKAPQKPKGLDEIPQDMIDSLLAA
jgi:L-amino acid N-acyltransferase YncA